MDKDSPVDNGAYNIAPAAGADHLQSSLLQIALRHRWVILAAVLVSLIAAFGYILKATPIYTSASKLYVEQSGPKIITEYKGVMTQSKNYLYTQGELIKSTPIVANVADDSEIGRFKTFEQIDNPAAFLKKNINVAVGKKDDIIKVSFDSPYPAEAAQIVNAVVNSYVDYHSSRKRSTVSEVLKILQKEKVKRDAQLTEKFQQLVQFTKENGIVSFDDKNGPIVFQRLAKLSTALTDAQLATINAKADFEAILSMVDEPEKIKQFAMAQPNAGVRVFVNDVQSQLQSELKDLELQLANAKLHCTEDHPSIEAIRGRIKYIKQLLGEKAKNFADAYLEVMRLRWTTAGQREDELLASFDAERKAAQDLGVKAAEYSVLQSELKRTERLCDILDNRIKELNVTEDVGALNISILEVAYPAIHPSRPQKAKIMMAALVLGLMLGFALALVRDWMDYRLRSADEISAVLGLPVLGVVPTILPEQNIAIHSGKALLKFKSGASRIWRTIQAGISSDAAGVETKTVSAVPRSEDTAQGALDTKAIAERGQRVHLAPKSHVAEAYRTIRTAVFFGVPKGQAKTIVITSPAPGDGKSTLASNLALTMAQAGQRTLVLDADFRKPVQHKIFEIDHGKGLSNVFAGAITLDEAIEAGPVEGLDILPCGPEVPNPSEILNSDTFANMLNELVQKYDRVIIDSPPVTPVADSQILAAICDVTIMVLRAEKSTRRLSRHARDNLLSVGGHLIGVVVNDVSQRSGRYGYGRYGQYGYYGYCSYYGHYGYGRDERQRQYA